MEGISVAPSVEIANERVAQCVKDLNALFDQIETDFLPKVVAARSAQTSTAWSSAPPAVAFRASMQTTLDVAETKLTQLWDRVGELCETLKQNVADLESLDATTAADLERLMTRASEPLEMPETRVPYAPGMAPPETAPPLWALPPSPTSGDSPFADLGTGNGWNSGA